MRYAPDDFTWSLGAVIARLGQLDGPRGPRTVKWMVGHVTGLIDQHGFPPPLPYRGTTRVQAGSKWLYQAVEAWLGSFMPPGASAAVEAAAMRQAGDEMDEAAAGIAARMNRANMRVVNGGVAA